MENYFKSEKHLANFAIARKKACEAVSVCEFCEIQFRTSNLKRHRCIYDPKYARFCLECEKQIFDKEHIKKFCNRSCSANYTNRLRSPESRIAQAKSVSKTMTGKPSGKRGITKAKTLLWIENGENIRKCEACEETFVLKWQTHKKKYCSQTCAALSHTNKWGQCLSIPYFCKASNSSIILQSTWEVKVAEKLDELDIEWIRPKPVSWVDTFGKKRKYYPDFYIPSINLYLDPKNPRVMEKDEEKIREVSKIIDLTVGSIEKIIEKIGSVSRFRTLPEITSAVSLTGCAVHQAPPHGIDFG